MATEQYNQTQSELSTPTLGPKLRANRRATSLDFELRSNPSTATTKPNFCCQNCIKSIKEVAFHDFVQLGSVLPPFEGSVRSIGNATEHVIAVSHQSSKSTTKNKGPTRYFVLLGAAENYREIDSVLFTYIQETREYDATTTETRITCGTHHNTYNLTLYSFKPYDSVHSTSSESDFDDEDSQISNFESERVTTSFGTSEPPLKPHELSLEKRRFMIRKLRYGRKDQMAEIIKNAVIEDGDKNQSERWRCFWQERRQEKEVEEMLDFEVRYCLERMRMFFIEGRMC